MRLKSIIAIALALVPAFGWAQMTQRLQPAAVQTSDPVAERLEVEAAEVEVVLADPPADITASGEMAAVPAIMISDIRIRGNRALGNEELDAITAEYEGRSVTVEELHELRQRLSRAYFDQGYVNSGVIIPDQQASDGIVTLQVVEGGLSDIVIDGNKALRDSYLQHRVTRSISDPLNIGELQTSLRLLQEEPLVSSVNAQLVPGETHGSGRLNLTINEQPPFELIIAADNHRSPSVSEDRGTIYLAHRSLFGRGDVLAGRYGLTQGVQDHGLSYSLPVSAYDTRIEGYYSKADSEIREKPFDALDIESVIESAGIVISHPFIRRLDRRFKMSLGFESRSSESTLLGLPFSFSAGEVCSVGSAACSPSALLTITALGRSVPAPASQRQTRTSTCLSVSSNTYATRAGVRAASLPSRRSS
jgi:hemolysin activation/secretion protein